MGKLDELRRGAAGNVAESMGVGRAARSHDATVVPIGGARYRDLAKAKDAFEIPVDQDRAGPQPAPEGLHPGRPPGLAGLDPDAGAVAADPGAVGRGDGRST